MIAPEKLRSEVARFSGLEPGAKIVPFRGEYYELVPERRQFTQCPIPIFPSWVTFCP